MRWFSKYFSRDIPLMRSLKWIEPLLDNKAQDTHELLHSEVLSKPGCLGIRDELVCWVCFCERLAYRIDALLRLRSLQKRRSETHLLLRLRWSCSCLIWETLCKQLVPTYRQIRIWDLTYISASSVGLRQGKIHRSIVCNPLINQ
jgi:hypothetical protein